LWWRSNPSTTELHKLYLQELSYDYALLSRLSGNGIRIIAQDSCTYRYTNYQHVPPAFPFANQPKEYLRRFYLWSMHIVCTCTGTYLAYVGGRCPQEWHLRIKEWENWEWRATLWRERYLVVRGCAKASRSEVHEWYFFI
jgi:hypothetical protein